MADKNKPKFGGGLPSLKDRQGSGSKLETLNSNKSKESVGTNKLEPPKPVQNKWEPPKPVDKKWEPPKQQEVKKASSGWSDDEDGWGDVAPKKAVPIDTRGIDYHKLDLNKCGDLELAQHKAAMDKQYEQNIIRPGDKGFEYDKRVDYSKV